MAAHLKLKAVFLVTILLTAEAHRVSIRAAAAYLSAQNSTSFTAEHNADSKALTEAFPLAVGAYGLAVHSGFYIAPAAAVAAPAAVATAPAWGLVVGAVAACKGVGLLAKPIMTRIAAKQAGQAVVVAATRTGLISQAASKLLPWAFTATPGIGQAFMVANIALTGWQLFQLQSALRDPTKLCALLAKIPGSPLSDNCVPGAKWGPPLPPPPGAPAALSHLVRPEVALAVLTTLVIAGGGAMAWHRHSQKAAYDQAFCPRSSWEIDPQLLDELDQPIPLPGDAHLESDAEIGMSKCSGFYYKAVPVDCALDDVSCRHLACQQACCDRKDCVAYQFTNSKSILNFTSGMGCYLSTKRVQESDCDVRWFGEIRSNFDPEVNETMFTLAGMWNPDPDGLREERWTADARLGHQVAGLKRVRPAAVTDVCDAELIGPGSVSGKTPLSEILRKREACERDQCREACIATRYCIFYQYQRKTTMTWKMASSTSRNMSTFYNDWHGVDNCYLGISYELKSWRQTASELGQLFGFLEVNDSIYMQSHPWKELKHFSSSEWHGGQRNVGTISENGCDGGKLACPSNHECLSSCQGCEGFALPGERGTCERSAEQGICDPSSWVNEYKGMKLNETVCSGLTRAGLVTTTVKVSEESDMNGHDLCREACCAEPQCKLYQVHQKDAGTKHYKQGSKMTCYLGILDSQQAPKFQCKPGGSYEGGYLFSRGCPAGTLACTITDDCVASCDQCSGAPFADASGTSCTNIAGEDVQAEGRQEIDKRKEDIVDDWKQDDADPTAEIPTADPTAIENETSELEPLSESSDCSNPPCLDVIDDGDPTFYLIDSTEEDDSKIPAAAEAIVKIAEYRDKIASQEHMASICDSLTIGAFGCEAIEDMSGCRCKFAGFKQQVCIAEAGSKTHGFFRGPNQLIPVFAARGMVLFAGNGCTCDGRISSSDFHWCTFRAMNKLPKVKLTSTDEFAFDV